MLDEKRIVDLAGTVAAMTEDEAAAFHLALTGIRAERVR